MPRHFLRVSWSDFRWSAFILGAVMMGLGLVLVGGGGWLIWLGGSLYYFCAGGVMVAAGYRFIQGRSDGAWLYLLLFIATLFWAWWEVGLHAWGLVPRVISPLVLLLFVIPAALSIIFAREP